MDVAFSYLFIIINTCINNQHRHTQLSVSYIYALSAYAFGSMSHLISHASFRLSLRRGRQGQQIKRNGVSGWGFILRMELYWIAPCRLVVDETKALRKNEPMRGNHILSLAMARLVPSRQDLLP